MLILYLIAKNKKSIAKNKNCVTIILFGNIYVKN